jgi:hypothetical protein
MTWKSRRTRHATVYAQAGSAAASALAATANRAERAIAANLALLGAKATGESLRLFVLASPADMRRLTGQAEAWTPRSEEGTSFLISSDSIRPPFRRETMRVLSTRHWGKPAEAWMAEGIATLAVGSCQGQTIDQMVTAARMAGLVVPLDTLRAAFVTGREIGAVHALEAASLIHYIDRKYGRRKLRALWTGGLAGIDRSLGVDLEALEMGWRASLSRITPEASWQRTWAKMDARGCE